MNIKAENERGVDVENLAKTQNKLECLFPG